MYTPPKGYLMTDISFYHLTISPLERALPQLLGKVLDSHKRAILLCTSQERLDFLNTSLWTLGKASFLPHGSAHEGSPQDHPIWLTLEDENPNGATILVQTDGADTSTLAAYERCLDLFNGNDEDAVAAARERWKKYKAAGHTLTYWTQDSAGAWKKGL